MAIIKSTASASSYKLCLNSNMHTQMQLTHVDLEMDQSNRSFSQSVVGPRCPPSFVYHRHAMPNDPFVTFQH